MKGTQLKAAVYNLTKDRLWQSNSTEVDTLVVDWVSLALDEFPPEAFAALVYPLMNITAGVPDFLPEDFRAAAYYTIYDGEVATRYETTSLEFTSDGQVIYPVDITSGDLYYYPKASFTTIADDLPLEGSLHNCLIYFFYAQYYYQSGEGDSEETRIADNYLSRFNAVKRDRMLDVQMKGAQDTPQAVVDAMPKRSNGRVLRSNYYE